MAIRKIKISELPKAESVVGLSTIGVRTAKETNDIGNVVDRHESVQVSLEFIKDATDGAVEAADKANIAAENADKATSNAISAAENADKAAQEANDAATAANTAAQNANDKGELAESAADAANKAADTIDEKMQEKLDALVANAPEALDTLVELAAALGNDPNFAATVAAELAKKATKEDIADLVTKIDDVSTAAAGGDLTGHYPDPVIGNGKVSTDKIADGAVTAGKIAEGVKLPTPQALTFTGGATGSFDGSEAKTVEIPTTLPASDVSAWAKDPNKPTYDFNEIQDAHKVWDAATAINRKVIYWLSQKGVGYGTRVAVGVQNGNRNWGAGVISVSYNDAGTAWRDYIFGSNGNMNIPGGYYTYSDERLKDFLGDLRVDWDAIKALPKKYYRLKDDEQDTRRIGTSAQELLKSYPEVVEKDADGMYRVDYAKLSIIALAAVSELEERLAELESKITQ